MVSLSPLLSNFGALSDGLTTIRGMFIELISPNDWLTHLAFCVQYRFQNRVITVTDAFQKMDHFYWSLQAWLMYRFDILSACATLLITLLALYTGVSPGLTAFVLVAASKCRFHRLTYLSSLCCGRIDRSNSRNLYSFTVQAVWTTADGFRLRGKTG